MGVPVERLVAAIEPLDDDVPDTLLGAPVRSIVFARSFDDLDGVRPGEVAVLDDGLRDDVSTYRFDLALGRLADSVPAIVVPTGADPSITARRSAASRSIVLARLRDGHDVTAVSRLLHTAESERTNEVAVIAHTACELVETIEHPDDIDAVLSELGRLLGTNADMTSERRTDTVSERRGVDDAPIRVHGVVRGYVRLGLSDDLLGRAVRSHLARVIEEVLIESDEAAHVSEAARSSLVNELLLGDAGTTADSASRLRRAGFPIDGSHTAIRLDCHDPVPDRRHADVAVKQRIAMLVTDHLRTLSNGTWTRAGTDNSIIVVWSRRGATAKDDEVRDEADALIRTVTDAVQGAQVFVGIGGTQRGVAGLSQTVMESATAARAPRAPGRARTWRTTSIDSASREHSCIGRRSTACGPCSSTSWHRSNDGVAPRRIVRSRRSGRTWIADET